MLFGILPFLEARRPLLRRWLLVQALVLLAAVPVYAAIVLAEHGQVVASFLWIPPLSWHFVWADAASLYGLRAATTVTMRLIPTPVPAIALVALVAGAIGFIVLRRRPGPRRVLLIGALGLPLVLTAISLIHPILLPRYLVWGPMPFFVLIGASIEALPGRGAMVALCTAALLLAANLSAYYRSETKPRWDLAAAFLAQRLQPEDVVLVADGAAPVMLRTYLGKKAESEAFLHATRNFRQAAKAFATGGHVYAVYGPAGQGKLPGKSAFFRSAEALGVAGKRHAIGDEITIERIGPPGSGVVACGAAGDVSGNGGQCGTSIAK